MNEFARFEALSFDCYGTLIDWETGIAEALAPWARMAGLDASPAELIEAFGRHETVVESEHPTMPYPEVLAETMRRIGDDFSVSVSDVEAEAFGASVGRWPAFPDAPAALAALAARYKLIILSNVDRASFRRSNDRLGVAFHLVITAEDVGAYKPSPASFDALDAGAALLGIDPGALLHVAESLYHDHIPAKARGLHTVWIHRRHDRPGYGATAVPASPVTPDWRFTSLAAFADAALEDGTARTRMHHGGRPSDV